MFLPQDCAGAESLARAAYEARRYEQAAQHFARAAADCGASAPILLALGQAQLLARRPADAVETLRRIRAEDSQYVAALKVQARALYLLARDEEAEQALVRAAERAPRDAEIPYDLGRIYYQQGRHGQAAESFRRATAIDPGAYRAWDNLGLASEALGDDAQAQQHYLKAIAIVHKAHPGYDVVYANFAEMLIKAGQFQRAFDLAAEAAQRNPDEPRNLYLAGKALVQLGRPDVSLRWLERAVALDANYPEPQYLLMQVYRRLGRPADAERARQAFQTAAARAPKVRR